MVLIRRFVLFFSVLSLLILPSFAAGSGEGEYTPYVYQDVYALPRNARIITADDIEPTDVEISVQALDPIKSSNSNGLKAILLNILGDYSAIQVEMRYTNTNGTYSYVREIQPDYVWFASAGIFALLLFCTCKAGGAILCRK